jgi:hypothetical protein
MNIHSLPFRNFIIGAKKASLVWEKWFRSLYEFVVSHSEDGSKHILHYGTVSLVAGVATVNTIFITDNNYVLITTQELGTVSTPQAIGVTSRSSGVSFTITSEDVTDTSKVFWAIID